MNHDVYICCDEKNRNIGDAVCRTFEENAISCWIKSRDMSSDDPVDTITKAIEASKCFVLILSKHSKDANYAIIETDIAFSREIPIVTLNLDDSRLDGNLEFILETQTKISAFPNPKKQLETLVRKTSDIIKKPKSNVKINSKSVHEFEKINPQRNENTIKKIIKIAVPIAVVLLLVYFFVVVPTGQNTTEDGIFAMNVTDVDVSQANGGYKYTVHGESYNMPSDASKYLMNIKFMDKDENLVFEINSTADEFNSGIMGSCDLNEDNITHVDFKLIDLNNKVLSEQKYVIE